MTKSLVTSPIGFVSESVAMDGKDKSHALPQTVPIPVDLRELSTDGGMTGMTNILKERGWDGHTPIMTPVHKLNIFGSIVGSKWLVQGSVGRVKIRASNIWTTVTEEELFLSISMGDLEQYRFLYF